MKKGSILLNLLCLSSVFAFSQPYKGQIDSSKLPVPVQHLQQEYTFDTTLNPEAWRAQKEGLHVAFGSTDELYFRTEVPELEKETTSLSATVWKGERMNAQVVVWSPDTLRQVRFKISDLKSSNGKLISKNNAGVYMVRYVVSNYPYGAKDATCGASHHKNQFLMPDRFESFEQFDVPAKTARPVWISLDVPQGTEAGIYNGTIEVKSENHHQTLQVQLTIQNQVLPKPHDWKHRYDLWQNPWVVAWENNVKPWSDDHKLLLKKHLRLYADAGGTYITTYAVHSPWADNSYMIEGGMIEWIKQKNGNWKFDYNIFDQYVQLAMSVGIDRAITLYTPVPWGFRFRYIDEATGNYKHESWAPDSKTFKDTWNIFLTDLKKHLEQKGWFDKTYIGINENPLDQTLAAIKVIKAHSPKWKITYAGDWHKELENLLDDYCFLYGKESDVEVVKRRATKGFTTTYYVCCNPPYPNNFVFSPPIEGRWISWYTLAHRYDGFLRWAYDAWPADPMRDARHTTWPAGDCFLVYPGGNNCIRFEKLREGIVDYEKVSILRQKAIKSTNPEVKNIAQQLEKHLNAFLVEKDFDTKKITTDVAIGKELVELLSNKLAGK
ncbi:MAG TPA: glycoside hydrolase domain-containing protein [Chitinophagaceae bacterium]|nr:glycoside hydrolase domain-containing protein [Chitinophagaceae bacterium]